MVDVTPHLNQIVGALTALSSQIQVVFPDSPSMAELWNWQQPGLTKSDIIDRISKTIEIINTIKNSETSDNSLVDRLSRIPNTINYIKDNNVSNATGGNAYFIFIGVFPLLESIELIIEKISPSIPAWTEIQDKKLIPAQLKKRIDDLNRGIVNVERQFDSFEQKIRIIEEAHQAASALPASLAGLEDATAKFENATKIIDNLSNQASISHNNILISLDKIEKNYIRSYELTSDIEGIQSAAIRQGLGKSFSERAKGLSFSTYALMGLLALSLGTAAVVSHNRMKYIEKILENPQIEMQAIWANVVLTAISVAAPVWFAWLLTRQIGQRFRLAEDYGFKASVAAAYEGYRRESEEIGDPHLKQRLLSIALDRVQEPPLSHIEREESASPFQDIIAQFARKAGNDSKSG